MQKLRVCIASVLLLPMFIGCSRQEQTESRVPDEEVYTITSTNKVVTEAEIPAVAQSRVVRADFNMDNLEDLAMAEEYEDGRSEISIYLQKRGEDLRKAFFKAGGIRPKGEYKITALMSKKGSAYVDLLVIFTHPDNSKEMVHYRTEGRQFREILRKPIGGESDSGGLTTSAER